MQSNFRPVAVLATLAAVSTAALAAPLYHVTDLGVGQARAMNQVGDAAGVANAPTNDALVFHAGKIKHLAQLDGGTYSIAYAINDSRVSVGSALDGSNNEHATRWARDGSVRDLGVSSIGGTRTAYGIDAQGTIIGADVNNEQTVGWFFDPQGTRHVFPTMPGGDFSWPGAINPDGQIAGSANTSAGGVRHCVVYTSGVFQDLGTGAGGLSCAAYAISTNGYIGGAVTTANGEVAVVWTGTTLQTIGTLGGLNSSVYGINASGVAVGNSNVATAAARHPFVWSSGTMTDLTTVLDSSGDHWSKMYVYDIDDQGRIVGTGRFKDAMHSFILTPVAN